MHVFILGVAGDLGMRVATALIRRGDQVSGLFRRPEQSESLKAHKIVGYQGDLANISEADLANYMRGTETLIFAAGANDHESEDMIDKVDDLGVAKALSAAELASVDHFLLVSVFPEASRGLAPNESFDHYLSAKKKAEIRLVHSDLQWLILRPSSLTDDPGHNRIALSPAEVHTTISRADVAETIVGLLHASGLRRQILELTEGSEVISTAIQRLTPVRSAAQS